MKKSLKIILVLMTILMFTNYVFAATEVSKSDATMKLVKDEICDITFGEYGSFEKKLANIDTENKTIDISLKVTNNDNGDHTHEEITKEDVAGEVVLLIDISGSMTHPNNNITINNVTYSRKDLVMSAADSLVDKLFTANPQIKIGVVEFASSEDEYKRGTDEDAKIVSQGLSNSKEIVKNDLNTVKNDTLGNTTDIDIGLKKANELLQTSTDTEAKKYIVLLTDGVPNAAEGISLKYSPAVINATKERLQSLSNSGINIISVLMGISDDPIQIATEGYSSPITHMEYAKSAFGTSSAPTVGSVYYIENEGITDTISNQIYKDLIPKETTTIIDDSSKYALTDIVIKDYIPQNIVDNFEFSLLTKPDKGTVTETIDTTDNSITWTIPELKAGETSTFTYRLSLKDKFSNDIVGINLPTNKDVTIDYKEGDTPGPQKHNDKCPIVALDVLSPKIIPKTGSYTWIIIGSVAVLAIVASIFAIAKSNK